MPKRPRERTVWERIAEALEDADRPANQPEAAKICGIEQPSVSDWNKSNKGPALGNALTLAKALNICVEWIYTERGPKRPVPPEYCADQLWSVWQRLSDTEKASILGYAEGLAGRSPTKKDSPDVA